MSTAAEPGDATRTTCPYCGVGCGVAASRQTDDSIGIAGDPDHPANRGRLCSKGMALADVLGLDGRLLHPRIAGRRATWRAALDRIAEAFGEAIAEHGPDSVAFYVSGQLLTEDYYVANKLMKGFIGSANIDTNSRLCMASSVAGHKRAFGSDTVPGTYEDLEQADLVVLTGSNLAWCHPVLYQRLAAAKQARPSLQVVVIDPRRTATAELADLHLPLKPDSDVALFNGLLTWLNEGGARSGGYVARHTSGVDQALRAARSCTLAATAAATELPQATLARFYDLFASTERVVTVYSQGVNQSTSGTDKVNAILNCHLLTGRIGRPGMGPFSVTGQPNAMGGREVGGLANQLACHMELENAGHRALVQRFWNAPRMAERPGLKAVELFQAVAEGRIKALWIMATNPADSLPEADAVRDAIAACSFVAVSDVVGRSDTVELADVLLPAAAWSEKDGTVTNSERRISRQRAFRTPPGEARPDWWAVCEVARRLGHGAAFDYAGPAQIFREYARLTAFENAGTRDLDIGGLAKLSDRDYDAMQPVQWPIPSDGQPRDRLFADGGFFTPDAKARFVPTPAKEFPAETTAEYPLVLNTGRIRDQWHTMTRTAESPRLSQHLAEPYLEMHPEDAVGLGLSHASLVTVESGHGRSLLRLLISANQRRGSVFAPMHWTDQFSAAGRIDALIAAATDPISGQPASKSMPVRVAPFRAAWHGFAVTRRRPDAGDLPYWALARADGGWRLELAGRVPVSDWPALAGTICGVEDENVQTVSYADECTGQRRYAFFADGLLLGALFASVEPVAVSRSWASQWLAKESLEATDRLKLLAGRGGADQPEPGALICSCFGVGANQIGHAAASGQCLTVDAVGERLGAGSNCGSCRSEIQRIIDDVSIKEAV